METSSRRLVIALASALGAALLAIAFLVGRMSAKPAVVAVAAPPPVMTPSTSTPAELSPEPSAATFPVAPSLPASPTSATPSTETALLPGAPPPPASIPGSSPSPDRAQIVAYFNQIDRLEDMGAGDPQAFANSMVQSMSSGDFSGFDTLLSKARTQRQRLLSITPPRMCVDHHRLALTLSGDSVAMLERLKAAMVKGDATALLTIATEGHTLETQANQLKALGENIKRQAGI
jgi:hypothetical protein